MENLKKSGAEHIIRRADNSSPHYYLIAGDISFKKFKLSDGLMCNSPIITIKKIKLH